MKFRLLFLFLIFLCSCQFLEVSSFYLSTEKKKKAKKNSPVSQNTWTQIENQIHKLPFDEKIKQLDQFIEKYQAEEIALLAYLLKAKLYLEKKENEKACQTYHQATRSLVVYTDSLKLYQESAQCHFKKAEINKAFQVLENFIRSSQVTRLNKRKARLLQWEFIKNNKLAKKQKLFVSSSLFKLSRQPQEKKKWKQKGIQIIQSLSVEKQLEYEKERDSFSDLSFFLDYKLGLYYFKEKRFQLAQKHFKQALSSPLSKSYQRELQVKLSLVKKSGQINPSLVGVILPLSGEKKVLGEKILRGLAFGFNRGGDSGIQMIIMDSKDHPDTVRFHVENLFYKHHVVALIGGLSSESAEVIAEKAEEFSIPSILFSQSQNLTKNRMFVFQNAISPQQLLTPLIRELRGPLKIDKVAIMYPDDSYGIKYSSFFEESFKKAGGRVTKKVSYKLGEFDFKEEVKELLHLKRKGREKEFQRIKEKFLKKNKTLSTRSPKLTPENILPPKKDFSALFIPDSSTARVRIRDYLKYFGLDSIYLVGLNLWKQDQLKEKDFSILFVNLEEKDKTRTPFYKNFFINYSQSPGYFEQRAYNTAIFLKQSLNFSSKSRNHFREQLEKTKSFQGAYHKIFLSEDRVFQYPIKLYKNKIKKNSKN